MQQRSRVHLRRHFSDHLLCDQQQASFLQPRPLPCPMSIYKHLLIGLSHIYMHGVGEGYYP